MRNLLKLIAVLSPWWLKRRLLKWIFRYELHPSARIGLSWIFPDKLRMEADSRIGHLNVAIHLHRVELGASSSIGRGNWITGFPKGGKAHFAHLPDRDPSLVLGAHAAVTKYHHLDCTDRITIGPFSTIAGYRSQFLTHSIDIVENRQDAAPISIAAYCFVGTNVVVLGGGGLPDYSVLGAKSLLNRPFEAPCKLYAGLPAREVKDLPKDARYFTREVGRVT